VVEIECYLEVVRRYPDVSVLYREPMWLKLTINPQVIVTCRVSVLYREPMWLKSDASGLCR